MQDAGVIEADERFELVEGEILAMNAKNNAHEIIKNGLMASILRVLPGDQRLTVESTLYLSENTFLEPDIDIYPKRFLPEDVRGPDVVLIIEVADTTKRYDLGRKADLYAAFGVPELWVIEADKRRTKIHRRPDGGNWTETRIVQAEGLLTHPLLPGWSVRLVDLD